VTETSILVLSSTLAVGGAERQLSVLVTGLRDHGYDVRVATLRERGRHFDALQDAGFEVAFADMRSHRDVRGAVRALRLSRWRPHLVLTLSADAHVIGHALARRAGAAHVAIEQSGTGMPHPARRTRLMRLVAPHVHRVTAVSSSQVTELTRLGYRADAIRIIPNGSVEPRATRTSTDVRLALGLGTSDFVALLVAVLRPEKRGDVFLEAVIRAHDRDGRMRGVVAGGGPLLGEMRARYAHSSGEPLLLGERTDVPDLMTCADVVCLTSDLEGIPLALVEAMALGRPIVATDVGGVPDLVTSTSGVLVPAGDPIAFADALLRVAQMSPVERDALGMESRRRYLEHFTADRMIEGYVHVLSELA
jgi:glycosyltransferase involved in cell wall biosynthesis